MAAVDLKTYRSNSMAGALAEVKKDLGPEAVILRTRNYKAGGTLGFGAKTVVEITAARDTPAGAAPNTIGSGPGRDPVSRTGHDSGTAFAPEALARMRAAAGSRGGTGGTQAGETPEFVPDATEPIATQREAKPAATQTAAAERMEATRVRFRPTGESAQIALESELASIRSLVSDVLRTTRKTAISVEGAGAFAAGAAGSSDPLFALYNTLCDHEVPADIADGIVAKVRDGLSTDETRDSSIVREAALRAIASGIRTQQPKAEKIATPGAELFRGPAVQALIGPTGVGKTTTIAKLAASYKLRQGKSVGLITADTYRIAAVDQLRTYAGIIGLPLEVVLSASDIPAALERQAGCDIVLIDTPGRSPRDTSRLDELAGVLDAAGSPMTHLVLSAGASLGVLRSAAERFGAMKPDTLILSKADEAGPLGVLCEAIRLTGLPLSYVTTGQEVPDDIEPARPDRLARAILDGGLDGGAVV